MTRSKALLFGALAAALTVTPLYAQSLQDEMIRDYNDLESKYVGLAEAMPEADYGWRPGEGVRSVSEVYMHIVSANFSFPGIIGVEIPADVPEAWYRNPDSVTDRATIVKALHASFDFLRSVVRRTSDEDMLKEAKLFGRQTNVRAVLLVTETHCHEHLGQSIAYARTRGVVPPWSR